MKKIVSEALFVAVLLLVMASNALASMEVKLSDISSGADPMAAIKPIMPQVLLVLGIMVAFLLISGAAAAIGGGIKVNMSQLLNSIEQRRSGWSAIGSAVAVVFLVTVALVATFELWNSYAPK